MRRSLLAIGVIASVSAGAAQGKECRGVGFPEATRVDGATLRLNGLGLRLATMLEVKVYVAALYVTEPSSDPKAILASRSPYELILQFLRDVGADDVRRGWNEGFAKNAKAELPTLRDRIAVLDGWMADMKSGERLTFTFRPGVGVRVDSAARAGRGALLPRACARPVPPHPKD